MLTVSGFAFDGRVVAVHDGDTLTVLAEESQLKVRLASIDAPELGQAFGRASRAELTRLCAGRIASVADQGKDRYGRTIGRVTCDQKDANASQIRAGMAWVFDRYVKRSDPLYALQEEARIARRGLWSDARPIAPWDWRNTASQTKQRGPR